MLDCIKRTNQINVEILGIPFIYNCKVSRLNLKKKTTIFLSRRPLRAHVSLFVILLWMCSVLLLTRKTPWPNHASFETTNENKTSFVTSQENQSSKLTTLVNDGKSISDETSLGNDTLLVWQPPFFTLDNIHMWPIQVTFLCFVL